MVIKPIILLSPYSRITPKGEPSPKNYPYFEEVVNGMPDVQFYQIGSVGEPVISGVRRHFLGRNMKFIKGLIDECTTFLAVDNFLPHMCHYYKKHGVVIFSRSDPSIFGYPENLNIYKDKRYFRKNQFDFWGQKDYDKDAFVNPAEVIRRTEAFIKSITLISNLTGGQKQ